MKSEASVLPLAKPTCGYVTLCKKRSSWYTCHSLSAMESPHSPSTPVELEACSSIFLLLPSDRRQIQKRNAMQKGPAKTCSKPVVEVENKTCPVFPKPKKNSLPHSVFIKNQLFPSPKTLHQTKFDCRGANVPGYFCAANHRLSLGAPGPEKNQDRWLWLLMAWPGKNDVFLVTWVTWDCYTATSHKIYT